MLYYLFATIDNWGKYLNGMAWLFSCVGAIACVFYFAASSDSDVPEKLAKTLWKIKNLLFVGLILGFISAALPTQKQLAFIIAAPVIVNNEDVQSTAKNIPEIMKLGTDYLKDILTEVKNEQANNAKM